MVGWWMVLEVLVVQHLLGLLVVRWLLEEMKERKSHFQKRLDHPHQRSEYQKTTHSSKSTDTTHLRRSTTRRMLFPD